MNEYLCLEVQMDMEMAAAELCRPVSFIRVPRQNREDQVAEGGVLGDEVAGTGGVSMLQYE